MGKQGLLELILCHLFAGEGEVGVFMGRSEPPVLHDNGSFLHDLHQRQNKLFLFKPIVHVGLEPNMRQVCIDMEHIQ